jgi:TatA/E family protein of Tat protein translocase
VGAPGPSAVEWLFIAALALIVLGPRRLPEVARSVGRGIREMREALRGVDEEDDDGDLSPLASDAVDESGEPSDDGEGDDPDAELDSATEPEPDVELDSTSEPSPASNPPQR